MKDKENMKEGVGFRPTARSLSTILGRHLMPTQRSDTSFVKQSKASSSGESAPTPQTAQTASRPRGTYVSASRDATTFGRAEPKLGLFVGRVKN